MENLLDHRLTTLMVVAQTGSLTAAAQQLFITQPAVSQQLASLEADLGVPLLVHQGRRVKLTAAATELVAYAQRLGQDNQAVLKRLRLAQTPPLRLGATRSLGAFLLPQLLVKVIAAGYQLEVTIENTAVLSRQLLAGQLDAALIEGNYSRQDFAAAPLGSAPFIGVAAQAEVPATLPALFDQLLIVREDGSGTREILTTWLAAHNAQLSDFRQTLALSSPTAIIELLKQGVGISFMYRALVANELARGALFELPLAGFPLEHPLNLIYLKESSFAAEFGPLVATAREVLEN